MASGAYLGLMRAPCSSKIQTQVHWVYFSSIPPLSSSGSQMFRASAESVVSCFEAAEVGRCQSPR